jgi:hypothetical protein
MPNSANPNASPPLTGGNYEPTDVNIIGVIIFLGILVTVILISHFVIGAMYRHFGRRLGRENEQITRSGVLPSIAASRAYFPFPREQQSPRADLETFRAREEAELNSYAWVDRKAGIVRMPIGQAMDLLLQKGLPVRSGSNAHSIGPSTLQLQQQRPLQSEPPPGKAENP